MAAPGVLPPTLENVCVRTRDDAALLLEAVLDGILSEYPRRLDTRGRDAIRPGHIYVVQMGAASAITRWTDGLTRAESGGSRRRGSFIMPVTCYIIDDPKVCKKVTPSKAWVRKVFTFTRTILGHPTTWKIIAYDFEGKGETRFRSVQTALSAMSPSPPSSPPPPPPPPPPPLFPQPIPLSFWPPAAPSPSPALHLYSTPLQSPTPPWSPPVAQPLAAAARVHPPLSMAGGTTAGIVAPRAGSRPPWTYSYPPSPSAYSPAAHFLQPLFSQAAASTSAAAASTSAPHGDSALTTEPPPHLRSLCELQSWITLPGARGRTAARRQEDAQILALFR